MKSTTFEVTYTRAIGTEGKVIVKAQDAPEALKNAAFMVYTGRDFRNATPTDKPYRKPGKRFGTSNRMRIS